MEDRAPKSSTRRLPAPHRPITAFSSLDDTVAVGAPPRQRPEVEPPHKVERDVQRHLLAQQDVRFHSLVVRRLQDGVCLEGIMEIDADMPDVASLAREVAGVNQVLNRLLVRHCSHLD